MTTKAQAKKLLLRDLATIIANNDDLFPETVPLELESREYQTWNAARNELVEEFERRAKP